MVDDIFNDYDDEILDIDEVGGQDIKINMDYYIHTAILKILDTVALMKDNPKSALLQLRIQVDMLEKMTMGAKYLLPGDYKKKLEEFKATPEYMEVAEYSVKEDKIVLKKFDLIIQSLGENKINTTPLKL